MKITLQIYLRRLRPFLLATCLLVVCQAAAWAQYCNATYNNACSSGDFIGGVNFAGIVNLGTGCGNPGTTNYTNFTGAFMANVVTEQPYTITVSPGPTWGQYFVAFIDINHDNDFADAGEFYNIGYSLGGGTVSNTIKVPCNALPGLTRLRIMCRYANTPLTQASVCSPNLSFGEVEDYDITITQATGTDARLTRFVAPFTGCGLSASEQVSVRIHNVGGQTINGYTVCYRINNGAPVCQTIAAAILPCDSLTHIFATPANLSAAGTYDFDAYVTVASDINHVNDTVSNYMVSSILVVNTLPYLQNFDANNGSWLSGGVASSWTWGTPTGTFINQASSSPKAWVTNLSGNYNTDELSYLASPCFNLSSLTADPYLRLQQLFDLEQFSDVAYVEMSTNGGTTWSLLGSTGTGNNWYNTFNNAWDGTSGPAGAWRAADHVLTGAAGSAKVRVRLVMDSDAFGTREGMGIDDIGLVDTLKNVAALSLNSPLTGCQLGANEMVTVSLRNIGSHAISNIPVCYKVNGGPAICETMTATLAPGATGTYTFTATVNMTGLGTYNIVSYANWMQDYTHRNDTVLKTVSNLPLVSAFPYRESFENGPSSWVSGGTAFNDWAWGSPAKATINTAGAGSKCWVTAGLTPASYQDNANDWVESPCFDMSSLNSPWVALKAFWQSEFSWDGTILEATTNAGATWTQVGAFGDPFNWYNDNSVGGLSNFGGTGDGWTGPSTGWMQTKHAVANLAGQPSVRFRIHFASDGSVTDDGFAFDDFIVADPPTVRLGNDTAVCANITLNPNLSGGTFAWTGGATTPTLTVTAPGTYILAFTDSLGLTASDTIVISSSPTAPVDLGANQTICHGDSNCFTVNIVDYPSVLWSTGATTGQICVSTAGTWSIQATDVLGCTTRDSVTTTVVALPTPSLGADTTLCAGAVVCLASNCGPNHTYIWNNGATTTQICVSTAGGYWVRCIDVNGCSGADSILVIAAPAPVALGNADTVNCPIVQFTDLSTGGLTSIHWDFGDGNASTSNNPSHDYTAAGNGSYVVTLIGTNGCGSDTTTFVVDVNCLVSIGTAFDNQLKMFPNPSDGRFKLMATLTGSAPVAVRIEDIHGKTVYLHDFGQMAGNFMQEISLDAAKGVYFVKMDVGGQLYVRKLVLQ
jgi:GEVED domain/PKD domain/Secretion system C-terminal sorting domain